MVTTKVAEPGPLIAMKIQAVMNRSAQKQGTDLLDIVRIMLDPETRPVALAQIGGFETPSHVTWRSTSSCGWSARSDALRWVRAAGGQDIAMDDLDLVAELLLAACQRSPDAGGPWM